MAAKMSRFQSSSETSKNISTQKYRTVSRSTSPQNLHRTSPSKQYHHSVEWALPLFIQKTSTKRPPLFYSSPLLMQCMHASMQVPFPTIPFNATMKQATILPTSQNLLVSSPQKCTSRTSTPQPRPYTQKGSSLSPPPKEQTQRRYLRPPFPKRSTT